MTTLNKNADLEARALLNERRGSSASITVAIKPILRFLWVYIACGNWRLGMRGYLWAGMNATGEFLRQTKAWEATNAPRVADPPPSVYHPRDCALKADLAGQEQ